jgi:hypothetical protein
MWSEQNLDRVKAEYTAANPPPAPAPDGKLLMQLMAKAWSLEKEIPGQLMHWRNAAVQYNQKQRASSAASS